MLRSSIPWLAMSALIVGSLSAALMISTTAFAQPAFNPPPSLGSAQATAPSSTPNVRGLSASSAAGSASPAFIAPQKITPTPQLSGSLLSTSDGTIPAAPTVLNNAKPVTGGEIVARVDGQIILASDVLWQVNQLIDANRDRIPPGKIDEARSALLRQQVMGMIDKQIIYADFRRKVPAENLPSITENLREPFNTQEVPRLVKMLKLNDRVELDAMLRKSGTSLTDLQRQFIERTIAGEWLRQMVPKSQEATHEEMLAYYNEHKTEYEYPTQAKWEEVMVRFDRHNGDRTAAWQAITGIGNDVWQQVAKQPGLRGPVFSDIAKAKSHGHTAQTGGEHGWTTQGALRSKAIDKALFSLQVGQLSNVIESDNGFHIIRVLERKLAGCTPFTEIQKEIREALSKDQRKGLAEVEMAKLRKNSRVWTLFDGDIPGARLTEMLQPTRRR